MLSISGKRGRSDAAGVALPQRCQGLTATSIPHAYHLVGSRDNAHAIRGEHDRIDGFGVALELRQ